jgi:peptidyl-prolyl cis-trans isomerase D
MSVLEKIRSRAGLLVGIVGVALLVFILQSAFESGNFFFRSDKTVGVIAGKSIDYDMFKAKYDEAVETQKRNSGTTTLDQQTLDGIATQVWNQFINEQVMMKEYSKLGIAVSGDELTDMMIDNPHPSIIRNLSDQQGRIAPQFADERTGEASPAKIRQFVQTMDEQVEQQWIELEKYMRQVRMYEKYVNIFKKAMYTPAAFAKRNYTAQSSSVNIKYVIKNYKTVADSAVTVTDEDLKKYYNAHQYEFKQEASRDIEYIAYDKLPSQEDYDDVKNDLQKVAEEFKMKKPEEDSSYVVSESDSRYFDMSFHTTGTLSPQIDTAMFKAPVGTVMGPYRENSAFIVAKLLKVKNSADSAKIRHILIAYQGSGASDEVKRSKDEAKKLADSLLVVLKKSNAKFGEFVEKYSDDGGKKMPPDKKAGDDYMGKGGSYGWVNSKSGFVDPFKNAGLDNKKGDIVIAESNYGYHIIEVMDSKGSQKKIQVVTIDRVVQPSSKTLSAINIEASKFASENNTNELFQKAVVEQKLNKRIAEKVKENDKTIAGLESPRELVRWAYDHEKGTVSEPMEIGNKYVVASIIEVREKGVAPLEQVKEVVTAKVIKEKKAEMFIKEFEAAQKGASIEAIASAMKLNVEQANTINFNTYAIPGSSSEPVVIATASVLKAKTMSKPIAGNEGVFLVYVDAVNDAPALTDVKAQQNMQTMQAQYRVDNELFEALKEKAEISEHLVKFGF